MACFINKVKRLPDVLKTLKGFLSSRNYGSTLFIAGNKATDTFAFLSPYLDFDRRFADLDKLKRDLDLRGFKIDAPELKETWDFYKYVDVNRRALEHRRMEIGKRIEDLKKKKELTQGEEKEIVALKIQGKVLKQDLKMIKDALWDLEDSVVLRALKLPNDIDDRTPKDVPLVLKIVGENSNLPENERQSHLEIGRNLGLLKYANPLKCYLCNDAAVFELSALAFSADILREDMIRIAGLDFGRSIVLEGSGLNHEDPTESFILANNSKIERNSHSRIHLVGGASLVSFLTMHAKQLINSNNFPLRYFATGRQYTPFPHETAHVGLFTVCQSSAAYAFSMVKVSGSEEYQAEFENLLRKTIQIYERLGIHYRIVMRSASELRSWESLRVSFEIWSTFNQQYVEVGFISACGDFISKRLLIAFQTKNGRDFPGVISGTILSVPRLLACLMEQNPQNFVIPECIKKYMERQNIVN
ncbi:serine--tRNA synthetase-like protein Slimp [Belonocnema kinseyi]|uniref:serine--tRNA synthetase-like protein Slimp n=1 Tax=Belonocnema kinseyi TaxID=2817044 RepID=UPI00143E05D0|nr:serine--tRNA synthetase-like protein Slimp [Belonocnema kinseyi]